MKRLQKILQGVALMAGVCACGETTRLEELKQVVDEVKAEGKAYTEEEWAEANAKFAQVLDSLENLKDLSADELKEMARLQAEYAKAAFDSNARKVMEQMKEAGVDVGSFLQGVSEGLGEAADSSENAD